MRKILRIFIPIAIIFAIARGENITVKRECQSDQHQCPDGCCIPDYYLCNGNEECSDGSDELLCEESCESEEFQCSSDKNMCLHAFYVCDGVAQCPEVSLYL